MNPNASIVKFDILREIGFASISGTFAAVGAILAYPVRILKITNTTNEDVIISFDGVNDRDYIPAGTFVLYDFCSNASAQGGYFELHANQYIYAADNGVAPTSGSVFATCVYADTKG